MVCLGRGWVGAESKQAALRLQEFCEISHPSFGGCSGLLRWISSRSRLGVHFSFILLVISW